MTYLIDSLTHGIGNRTDSRCTAIITMWYTRGSNNRPGRSTLRCYHDIRMQAVITWPILAGSTNIYTFKRQIWEAGYPKITNVWNSRKLWRYIVSTRFIQSFIIIEYFIIFFDQNVFNTVFNNKIYSGNDLSSYY